MISVVESFAQAENESISQNIRWGIKERVAKGTSEFYDRKCYGYDHDEKGKLVINSEEAEVVEKIFDWYLRGKSVLGILKELKTQGIKSPTGKDRWCKRTIDVMLSNEKYIGRARFLDSVSGDVEYLVEKNNPSIISSSVFNRVHQEKKKRNNAIKNEDETIRKDKKYSSEKK